jgi:hypothetical protein
MRTVFELFIYAVGDAGELSLCCVRFVHPCVWKSLDRRSMATGPVCKVPTIEFHTSPANFRTLLSLLVVDGYNRALGWGTAAILVV